MKNTLIGNIETQISYLKMANKKGELPAGTSTPWFKLVDGKWVTEIRYGSCKFRFKVGYDYLENRTFDKKGELNHYYHNLIDEIKSDSLNEKLLRMSKLQREPIQRLYTYIYL